MAPALLLPERAMKRSPSGGCQSGFTLIEMLVVLVFAMAMVGLALPILFTTVRQAKLRGVVQETTVLLRRARIEAVKTSFQAVVRIVLPTVDEPGKVEAFSDRDANGKLDAGEPIIGRLSLPAHVQFKAPPDLVEADSVDGFSPDPAGPSLPNLAVFQGSGAIAAVGAFRFGDYRQNYLEVRVQPAATARVEVRKALEEGSNWNWYASGDGSTSGDGRVPWEWY